VTVQKPALIDIGIITVPIPFTAVPNESPVERLLKVIFTIPQGEEKNRYTALVAVST